MTEPATSWMAREAVLILDANLKEKIYSRHQWVARPARVDKSPNSDMTEGSSTPKFLESYQWPPFTQRASNIQIRYISMVMMILDSSRCPFFMEKRAFYRYGMHFERTLPHQMNRRFKIDKGAGGTTGLISEAVPAQGNSTDTRIRTQAGMKFQQLPHPFAVNATARNP